MVATVLLFTHQLSILFLFCLAAALSSRSAFAQLAVFRLDLFLRILSVDLGEDFFDAWVWIRVDEVTEQVSKT